MSAVANNLDEARALIENAWTQECYVRDCGGHRSYCAIGALSEVLLPSLEYFEAKGYLYEAINGESIIDWNDAPERTQAEVIDAFKRAAELAREQSA